MVSITDCSRDVCCAQPASNRALACHVGSKLFDKDWRYFSLKACFNKPRTECAEGRNGGERVDLNLDRVSLYTRSRRVPVKPPGHLTATAGRCQSVPAMQAKPKKPNGSGRLTGKPGGANSTSTQRMSWGDVSERCLWARSTGIMYSVSILDSLPRCMEPRNATHCSCSGLVAAVCSPRFHPMSQFRASERRRRTGHWQRAFHAPCRDPEGTGPETKSRSSPSGEE